MMSAVLSLIGDNSFEQRTENVAKTLRKGINSGKVTGLNGWRGEAFPFLTVARARSRQWMALVRISLTSLEEELI